jgi:exopolysaccharide biosynthesis polyprenyl glycosylphosphotransferase
MHNKTWKWLLPVTVILDLILLNVAFFLAYWVRYELQWFRGVEEAYYVPFSSYLPSAVLLTGILMLVFLLEGVYTSRRVRPLLDEIWGIFRGVVTGIATMILISLVYRPSLPSRLIYAYDAAIVILLLGLSRWLIREILGLLRKRGIGVERVLIVGAGETGRALIRSIVAQPELGFQLVGFVDDAPDKANTDLGRIKALGDTNHVGDLIGRLSIDQVIISLPWMAHRKVLSIIAQCERQKVRVRMVPDLFQLSLGHVDIDAMNGLPLIGVREPPISGWNLAVKRGIDVVGAALGLLLLSPILLPVALLIRLDSPGSVLFRQARVGKGGKEFTVFKFRTMVQGAENIQEQLRASNQTADPWFKLRDDPRRTRIGKFLRRSSIDELPQLLNVLRGEMSLVGPRPGMPVEVAKYQPWHMKRLQASPGMTGLWQVSGRSELTFDEMVLLDLYYIENWSLVLDFKILLRTIPAALSARGAF